MKIVIAPFSRKLRNGATNAKDYPYWPELIKLLKKHLIIQVGVDGEEQLVPNFKKNLSLDQLRALLKEADLWISVDSFLQHLADGINKKGVVIWSVSDPNIFGYENNLNILKDRKYLRQNQFDIWEAQQFNKDAFLSAKEVFEIIKKNFNIDV